MKATGIVRRIDELGRVVIPKEIRRTLRIREGDPSQITLTRWERFCFAMDDLAKRQGWKSRHFKYNYMEIERGIVLCVEYAILLFY